MSPIPGPVTVLIFLSATSRGTIAERPPSAAPHSERCPTLDSRQFRTHIRVAAPLLLVCTIVGIGAGAISSIAQSPEYDSTAGVLVTVQSSDSPGDLATGTTFAQQILASYGAIATDPIVLQPVITALHLTETPATVADQISVDNPTGTLVLEITATTSSPVLSAQLANGVSASLANAVDTVTPAPPGGKRLVSVTQTQQAVPNPRPATPNTTLSLVDGGMLGLAIGVGLSLLRAVFDKRIRSEHDLAEVTDLPVLGGIPTDDHGTVALDSSARAESYRTLRTNLQFVDLGRGCRTIVVTSPVSGDGKTTTAINLALAFAAGSASVALVDADLRRPGVHGALGLDGAIGLTSVLVGAATLRSALQPGGSGTLMVLPAGQVPPNPTELLQSKGFATLMSALKRQFDVIIVDGAPLVPVVDSAIVATHADGAG